MQWQDIEHTLKSALGSGLKLGQAEAVSGGNINQAFKLHSNRGELFIKLNHVSCFDMFVQESAGLVAIAATNTIRTPNVIIANHTQHHAFLVLQYHEAKNPQPSDWQLAAEQLAAMHSASTMATVTGEPFGFSADNYIGSTPQPNSPTPSWSEFFAHQRIGYQLSLLKGQLQLPISDAEICQQIESILQVDPIQPSLLHGDLWRGNLMFDKHGPLLVDPACYIGDAEADIAMTDLFGGFPAAFYQAYRSIKAAPESLSLRHDIYNLYHLLNHATLFGGHYLDQAEQSVKRLIENGS
ncbi:fructosamine kinase family protein [Neiella sp. HB171785]|uniref:Fructosamine kinase family protein n=1 Tax=Neiella litorisoli TaxID=2771431 RepID=A0A8J6QNJ6_9GAMM|nr:fructosamine kinase family protein [Neiella litorisoli]MBD1387981.1 fructosamine kinase family protein [Neiella litorisoli]